MFENIISIEFEGCLISRLELAFTQKKRENQLGF